MRKKMAFRLDLGGDSFIALVLILTLISNIFLIPPAGATTENQVEVNVMRRMVFDLDTDVVSPGEYHGRMEYNIDLWNGRDDSGESLREIKMTIIPKYPEEIIKIHTENLNLISREPIIATGEGIGEDDGASICLVTKTEKMAPVPLQISRGADVTYFEDTGKQVVSVVVIPKRPLNDLGVSIDFGEHWGEQEAEVRFVSASKEYFGRVVEDRAEFHVDNPIKEQEYRFSVQLEVTPLHEKVSYLPGVWVCATTDRQELGRVGDKVYQQETEFGLLEIESVDEVSFNPVTGRGFAISVPGISTRQKLLDIGAPTATPPTGQPIMGREYGFYGIDWEFVGLIVAVLGALAGIIVTWVKGRKKRDIVSRYIEQIDAAFTMPEAGPAEKREELKKIKRMISNKFSSGKIDESVYVILDKRIDDCLKEL